MITVYLAHNMSSKEYGHSLQAKIESLDINVYNPFDRVEQHGSAESIVETEIHIIEDVVDAVVTVVTDQWAAGSHMESIIASRYAKKPVFVLWLAKRYSKLTAHHIWYDYLTNVFDTEEQLLNALKAWIDQ